jgi:DNA-directed RNA polymerase subunit RPC12/RpoP
MSKTLTIQEEIRCDICGKEIYGNHSTNRAGNLYLSDGNKVVQYGMNLLISYANHDPVEYICVDCLRDFLENLAKHLS